MVCELYLFFKNHQGGFFLSTDSRALKPESIQKQWNGNQKCILKIPFPVASALGISSQVWWIDRVRFSYRCGLHSASAESHRARKGGPGSGQVLAALPGSLNHDTPPHVHILRLVYPWVKLDTTKNVRSIEFFRKFNIHFHIYTGKHFKYACSVWEIAPIPVLQRNITVEGQDKHLVSLCRRVAWQPQVTHPGPQRPEVQKVPFYVMCRPLLCSASIL